MRIHVSPPHPSFTTAINFFPSLSYIYSAIFQRKGGPAHSSAEAKKAFRMILMAFLRTAQLEDAHLTECENLN